MVSNTLTSALVVAVLFLGSTSAYEQKDGALGKLNGRHGIVQCICYTDASNTQVHYEDTKKSCENVPNGMQYPNDPDFIGECIFFSYEDRKTATYNFWPWCSSGYDQCCNTQYGETETGCGALGPKDHHPPPQWQNSGHHPPGVGQHPPRSDSKSPALVR
ncbi:unnamed protein product [Zymoseptoria tritici ST99CH_3D1]|uniref:Secreted protein n=2 Tax=Zymoseptoria tritici TaxID=1047171 RepID=F9WXH4_ZYMTI|nr:uncharacterized protein MYCGRDRAFT_88698 [Zymoseptoria tritici IPO323]EGP90865.1 hypothetical protein MYCGRDRAFT_88698 [Zymoseptoria tritici IPO323]SMQ44988.1 unnamed protein product [Zymoseptoria tritici ST99CH_3D7]SMR43546.1 unnamed protein product [Zymoseptoria tritici ST99CH_3D1]